MADRTPRIFYANGVYDAGLVITASSQDLPVRGVFCLLDPTPSRRWRSKLGWNVVSGFNNKIYFTEAAVARIGTIVVGNYPSGTAMAAAVQTAMNTAPGVTQTYTVTYVGSVFTITRATGASAVVLSFGVSNNDSIHQDLAFDSTNVSAVGGASASAQAYKSREWIKLHSSSSVFPGRTGIVYAHNMLPSGAFLPALLLQRLTTDTFDNYGGTGEFMVGDDQARLFVNAGTSLDVRLWVRILIDDVRTGTVGYSEVGVIFYGDYLEPTRGVAQGWEQEQGQLTNYAVSDTGSVFVDLKPSPRSWSVEWRRLSRTDRDALVAFQNVVRVGGSFFFSFDPANFPGTEAFYVYLTRGIGFTQRVGSGSPPDRFDVAGFAMNEHL